MKTVTKITVALAVCALALAPAATADAAPYGTTTITPKQSSCGDTTLDKRLECAAYLTQDFLRDTGRQSVVRETVKVPVPGLGVWINQRGNSICGYAHVADVMVLGAHHCDRTTFIDTSVQREFMDTDVRATALLIHESGHGVQEAKGLDLAIPSLTGDAKKQKPMELSADCWSGVGVKNLIGRGKLPSSAHRKARQVFADIGDPRDTLHGTSAERSGAFEAGYQNGVGACNKIAGQNIF